MNGNYLKIALRRIFRNYRSTLIVFIGVVIGLTSCLIIYTKINYELSFDSSHSGSKNIYRVVRVTSGLEYTDGGLEYRTGVHFPFPGEIRKNILELKNVAAMFYSYGAKINVPSNDSTGDKTFVLDNGIVFTEPSFFEIFNFGNKATNWLGGPGKHVLEKPFTAVITKETAGKLFLNQDPVGKDINVFGTKFTVEGVIEDLPVNSDFPFRVFLSLTTLYEKLMPGSLTDWRPKESIPLAALFLTGSVTCPHQARASKCHASRSRFGAPDESALKNFCWRKPAVFRTAINRTRTARRNHDLRFRHSRSLDGLLLLRGIEAGLLSVDPVRLRHHVKQGNRPRCVWNGSRNGPSDCSSPSCSSRTWRTFSDCSCSRNCSCASFGYAGFSRRS